MRQKLISISQTLRLPSICILCNQFHQSHKVVCAECMHILPQLGSRCIRCAYPLVNQSASLCGYCIKKPPAFDKAYSAYRFEEPLRSLIHDFKYSNGLFLGPLLCQLMLDAFEKKPSFQCLIPVPMHPQKLRQRGFNQAVVLAKLLAKKWDIPYSLSQVKKIKNTAAQATLDGDQRQNNLKNAFEAKPLPYQHVVIVDDLITSGSTANELARALKHAGVLQVDVLCCARAVYN